MFEVIDGGLQSTVQDVGRPGHLRTGIPVSGAQDSFALRMGNLVVGNGAGDPYLVGKDPGLAGVEMQFLGMKLRALKDMVIAATGAFMDPKINGQPMPMWEAVRVKEGDQVFFGAAKKGARGYLTVAGGIDVPVFLGSRSTYTRGTLGGHEGRALKKGDVLKVGAPSLPLSKLEGRKAPEASVPTYSAPWEFRVVLGPQNYLFTDESVETFLTADWKLSPTSDRMGARFIGPKLEFKPRPDYLVAMAGSNPSNIVDDVSPVGGVQVPGGLEPIAFGADGPSMGGYAKIATLITPDIGRLGQAKPGEICHFRAVDVEEATAIAIEAERLLV
jgi:biotin-dependent carboxylase-like uncharacterized protein